MRDIAIVVPTSPIPSHPSTAIIEETLDSIRFHFPVEAIFLMVDGVREEATDDERMRYLEYVNNLIGIAMFKHKNVKFLPFPEHTHQAAMLRKTMQIIPIGRKIMFVEHDTPLVKSAIPWNAVEHAIDSQIVRLIRFLPEVEIHPEHAHLMLAPLVVKDVPLTPTIQFSARPHLAAWDFYDELLQRFSGNAKCFIEDKAHGICQGEPWDIWRMSVYTPPGDQKFSYHTDGRAGANKYDERQIF